MEEVTELKEKKNESKQEEKEDKLVLKNSDLEMLVNSWGGVDRLRKSIDLPIVFSFELGLLLGELDKPIKAYSDAKQKLIEKYADRDKDKKLINPMPGQFLFTAKAQWFQKDFDELLAREITIHGKRLFLSLDDIPGKKVVCPKCQEVIEQEGSLLSADNMVALRPIVEVTKPIVEVKR